MRNRSWRFLAGAAALLFASNGAAQLPSIEASPPSVPTPAAKPAAIAAPPTLAERRLEKARILADLMAPAEATLDSTVANVALGFRIGFEEIPGNRKLIADYPGVDDAILKAMKPRVRQLAAVERVPALATTSALLVEHFSTAELDQGIRLFRHPVMIKFVQNSIANARSDATARDVRSQLAKGTSDPKLSDAAIKRDTQQTARRASAQLSSADLRALAPFLQSEFAEKFSKVRPMFDRRALDLTRESVKRMAADEELQTLALATMAEYVAKADAAKAIGTAAASPTAK